MTLVKLVVALVSALVLAASAVGWLTELIR